MTAPKNPWHREYAFLLLGFALASILLLGFAEFVDEVVEGDTLAVDRWFLHLLRDSADLGRPRAPAWLTVAMMDITALGGTTILTLTTVFVAGFLLLIGKSRTALLVTASVSLGTLVSHAFKALVERPRPDMQLHLVEVSSASFPSGHAMLSAIVYLTLAMLLARVVKNRNARLFIVAGAILLVMLIGLSRVYLGVHYPTDVIAGWCVGAAWAGASFLIATRILPARGAEP